MKLIITWALKNKALLIAGLIFPELSLAADLVIEADSEYLIDKSQQVLHLDKIMIGDNAQINFADDVTYWSLNANKADIGRNVLINGRGKSGVSGKDGVSWNEKENCGDGRDGGNGGNGTAASSGVNLSLNIGVVKLGSLTVDASGGQGGPGGNGGKGEDAGFGKTCLRSHGGNGGFAGNGGAGGNGGDIRLVARSESSALSNDEITSRLTTLAELGVGGASGKAGSFGSGSPSQMSNIPTVTGGRRRTPAGKDGNPGESGEAGVAGSSGSVSISSVTRPLTPQTTIKEATSPISSNRQSEKDAEIQDLKQQLNALQQRLEQLEQQ